MGKGLWMEQPGKWFRFGEHREWELLDRAITCDRNEGMYAFAWVLLLLGIGIF